MRIRLARSRAGFVTELILDAGNVADCNQLVRLMTQNIANTGLVPASATTDDGYASAEGMAQMHALGVAKVSISEAKGRALLGEELWHRHYCINLRAERSAIESLMFTLKFNHGFGRPGHRGLAAVRSELTLKILAHNFDRKILVRARRSEKKAAALGGLSRFVRRGSPKSAQVARGQKPQSEPPWTSPLKNRPRRWARGGF